MKPQTVITTDTNGVSVTNIVMVKKTNGFPWAALFEGLGDALDEVDFGGSDISTFDFDTE